MNSGTWQQLKGELISLGASVSSHGFTAGFDFVGGVPRDIVTTFPQDWLEEYQGNNYVLHDPVVVWGGQYDGVCCWDDLARVFPGGFPDVVAIARTRGMKNGSVISMTVNRRKAIMGVTHEAPELSSDELLAFQGVMANLLLAYRNEPEISLSPKGLKYLKNVALGLSDQEIAVRENITPRAVSGMRDRVLGKLGASTLPAALLSAYKSRLID